MHLRSARIRAVAGIAALVVAACSAAGTPTPSATPLPVATASPTTAPSPGSAAPTSSAAPSTAALIPDGLYETAPIKVADAIAIINADTKLSSIDKNDLIDNGFEFRGHGTFVVTLNFAAGKLDQGLAIDGGAIQIGDHATDAFSGSDTLVMQERSGEVLNFRVTWNGPRLTIKGLTASSNESDAMARRILFESAPFSLVP